MRNSEILLFYYFDNALFIWVRRLENFSTKLCIKIIEIAVHAYESIGAHVVVHINFKLQSVLQSMYAEINRDSYLFKFKFKIFCNEKVCLRNT